MNFKNEVNFILEKDKELKRLRGEIIEKVVYLEKLMNYIIASYFCKEQTKQIFMEHVLEKEHFTFSEKCKLFHELQIHKPSQLKNKYNGYSGKLMKINEIRNAFAHGFLQHEKEGVNIWYTKNGTKKVKVNVLKTKFFELSEEL